MLLDSPTRPARTPSLRAAIPPASRPTEAPASPGLGLSRIVERGAALLLLTLASPVIVALGALVRLTSPGPAIYRQARRGLGGRTFVIHKLRTMADRCEAETGPTWSPAGDPRITPFGKFLRRSHLDELPQLWDVARGEMALIGPRPERPEITPRLEREIPRYRERERVLPGITGLAQVSLPPDREIDDVRAKLEYDLLYIARRSPMLDLWILAMTARKMALGLAGAARAFARPATLRREARAS